MLEKRHIPRGIITEGELSEGTLKQRREAKKLIFIHGGRDLPTRNKGKVIE